MPEVLAEKRLVTLEVRLDDHLKDCTAARERDIIHRERFEQEVKDQFKDIRDHRDGLHKETRRYLWSIISILTVGLSSTIWFLITHPPH